MNKKFVFMLLAPCLLCCKRIPDGWKQLDSTNFTISVPNNWNYKIMQGVDSFVGEITTSKSTLGFDYSNMGYANHLTPTVEEYLKTNEWLVDCPLYKVGVTYTASLNVKNEKLRQMKEKGTTDSTAVKVEADPCFEARKIISKPSPQQLKKYPKADLIADLIYKDDTAHVSIQIPAEIKAENIQIDSNASYVIKTVWPKITGRGITGVYIKSRKSPTNFNLVGRDLSAQDQAAALQAFKTIQLKK